MNLNAKIDGLYYYAKGNDLVTGAPIVLTSEGPCEENSFDDEILKYGFNRLCRLGIQSETEFISKRTAIDLLKGMNKEDVYSYIDNVKLAKKKHLEMIKKHIMHILNKKQLSCQENIEMKVQQMKVRDMGKH